VANGVALDRSAATLRWFDDPYTALQVKRGIAELLDIWCAKGDPVPQKDLGFWKSRADQLGSAIALGAADQIFGADPNGVPLDKLNHDGSWTAYSDTMKRSAHIRLLLGPIVDRVKRGY